MSDDNGKLANQLKRDIETGESQIVEFKKTATSDHDLAEAIAGFATSKGGRIYIGVDDDGRITGVNNVTTGGERDAFQRRMVHVSRDIVKPPICVKVSFIEIASAITVRVDVPEGKEPIYYSDYRPYARDLSTTRKLEPSEVKWMHHLKRIKTAKAGKPKETRNIEEIEEPKTAFKTFFNSKLDKCLDLVGKATYDGRLEDSIDELLMIVKGRIEKWDIPSVRFCTRELFMKFYKVSEGDGLCELYEIFRDLFCYAYSQRRRLIGSMIGVFQLLLFESWVPDYDVEKGEKAAKVLLRLGSDFLNKDPEISDACLIAIDNLAGDMFEPEILSKEILLGAAAFEKISENVKVKDLVEKIADWIGTNDRYAWDDETRTYLQDAIDYAEWEQERYKVDIENFKQNYLLPAMDENINTDVQEYVDFLGEIETECERDLTFPAGLLAQIILAYEYLRPNIHNEIKKQVDEKNDNDMEKIFKRIVDSNNFLSRVYEESDMITTMDEFVRFLENNAETEGLPVGTTTWGISFVNFRKKLSKGEIVALEKIVQKYALQDDFEYELTDESMSFLMDTLAYSANRQYSVQKLASFLQELNEAVEVESLSTGMELKFRRVGKAESNQASLK